AARLIGVTPRVRPRPTGDGRGRTFQVGTAARRPLDTTSVGLVAIASLLKSGWPRGVAVRRWPYGSPGQTPLTCRLLCVHDHGRSARPEARFTGRLTGRFSGRHAPDLRIRRQRPMVARVLGAKPGLRSRHVDGPPTWTCTA